jgi:hypothetical protein
MHAEIRRSKILRKSQYSLSDIAKELNPILRGWFNYYGKYTPSALERFKDYLQDRIAAWAMRKYKKLRGHKVRAILFIKKIRETSPNLFFHWKSRPTAMVA